MANSIHILRGITVFDQFLDGTGIKQQPIEGVSLLDTFDKANANAPNRLPSTPQEVHKIALDAYIYGYSLITTDVTRLQMSNVPKVEELHAPTGTFFNFKRYPPATYRGVSATNADTLHSVAWLDLSEPQVFSHPEVKDRFFTFELVDLWMIVKASVGTTSGSRAMTANHREKRPNPTTRPIAVPSMKGRPLRVDG
jgi:hypothetical protein